MDDIGIAGFIIIVLNVLFSYKGFNNRTFFDGYKFHVDSILIRKDYKRLITSGFLHADWNHLIFNMISLYLFSGPLENRLGILSFVLIYLISLIGGNLLALYIHRNHGEYSAIGASGAVCGVIFASIALFPGMGIGFIFIPISIPSWVFGLLYVGYSIYGIKSQRDNIGHEAHLGGALLGMLFALAIQPSAFQNNYFTILIILIPTLTFIYFIITKPHILLINNLYYSKNRPHLNLEHKYNENRVNRQKELDKLLDKISKKGIESLSEKEKRRLEELSGN